MATIAKRRDRYVIDFYDHTGRRQRISMPKGATKQAARDRMREIEEQVSRGVYLPGKKIPTFGEVAQDWLAYKRQYVRENTFSMYEMFLRTRFETLNDLPVNKVSMATIERFFSEAYGTNLTTLRKVSCTIGQIMQYALRHKYIAHNPVRDAEKPRDQGKAGEPCIKVLTPPEIRKLLDAEKDREFKTLFMLAIMSGARQGELLGLKWSDTDWETNQISIQRSFNKGKWYKPKSRASTRRIDLGNTMMTELRKWKLSCPPNALDLVFPSEAGTPLDNHNVLTRHFRPALKKAGLPRIRFHDLRHTYASLLIEQKENIKYVQTQLGHSTPMMTLNVYSHLMTPCNQDAPNRLEDTVFEGTGHKLVTENKKGVTA